MSKVTESEVLAACLFLATTMTQNIVIVSDIRLYLTLSFSLLVVTFAAIAASPALIVSVTTVVWLFCQMPKPFYIVG